MVVNTMTITVNAATGVINVTPTLPGGAGAPSFMLFLFRPFGSTGKFSAAYMTLSGGVPQTRTPLPYTRQEFVIRVVDVAGVNYDSPVQYMNYAQSTSAVTWTEVHVPARAKIGELSKSHAIQMQFQNGNMVPGSIVNPTARPLLVPQGSAAGPYVASGKTFTATNPFVVNDEGVRMHSFALGA